MTPLTPRFKSYLDAHASQWVPAPLLYSLASSKGYSHDDIKRTLSEVSHTPPYASWSVNADDHHATKEAGVTGAGVYYKKQPMTPAELERNHEALDAFDAL